MAVAADDHQRSSNNPVMNLAGVVLAFAVASYARFAAIIGALILSAYVVISAASVLIQPQANWDILPYIAVSGEAAHPDAKSLHDFAYGAVRDGVSAANYDALTTGDDFRQHMAAAPEDFVSLLGMYRVKVLYGKVLGALSHVMSPVDAVHAVSIASTLAFGLFTLLWLSALRAMALAPFVVAVMIMTGFGDAARVGTPDMLCAALFLGGMYAYVRKYEALTAALLFLAFLARPDNIIFATLFALCLVAARQRSIGVMAAFVASFVSYFAVSHYAGHPGWWPHLYFSTIHQQLNMTGFHPDFSAAAYLTAFAKSAYLSLEFNSWVGVALLALGLWFVTHHAGFKMAKREGIAFLALSLSLAAKFVVFPIHDTRVYFPALIPLFLILVPVLQAYARAAAANAFNTGKTIS